MKHNKYLIIAVSLFILFVIAELVSSLMINHATKLDYSYPFFNRQLSGYYVFENTAGYRYAGCIKAKEEESCIEINKFGFVSGRPLTTDKKQNEIRIFLTGGSAAFGNGQTVPYGNIKEYPQGVYTFESSIAGLLEKDLQKKHPKNEIRVINAAASARNLHQSAAYYMETLKDFKPDIVISFDGNNDVAGFSGLSQKMLSQRILDKYAVLYEKSKYLNKKSRLKTVQLYKRIILYKMHKQQTSNFNKNSQSLLNYDYSAYTYNDYRAVRQTYIKNAEGFLKLLAYFHALCATDEAAYIFCLQPMLYRQGTNKSLSPYEKKMQQGINPINITLTEEFPKSIKESLDINGSLLLKYFFDDYLSEAILNLSENKFTFVDMNKEIRGLDEKFEFYTDYCHLTYEGNAYVAKVLSEKISDLLNETKKK